ncbi:UNVERIFIED_CONTAM: L-threonate dehydrogenase [Sesamum latifolium]|uniref:L-threonate dehydrogenase n=1 Tax=Sesamum latifolium TaxID=2727402 RepID=A0AAW2UEK2_9LAMI
MSKVTATQIRRTDTRCVNALVILISHVDQINDLFFADEGVLREDYQIEIVVDMYASKAVSEVLNGKVMIISSGQPESISRAQPFLSAMGEKLFLFEGDIGAGSKSKMVIELLEEIHFVASLEAMSLGAQAGIHPRIIYDIISNAAGNSWMFENRGPHMVESDYTPLSALDIFVKDLVEELLSQRGHALKQIEVSVDKIALKSVEEREEEINHTAEVADVYIKSGKDTLVMTSRQLVVGKTASESLEINFKVSSALVEIVRRISTRPRYILAKECIKLGVRKFNVNTEVRRAYMDSLTNAQKDLVHVMQSAKEAMKAVVAEKMQLFGSAGKAH